MKRTHVLATLLLLGGVTAAAARIPPLRNDAENAFTAYGRSVAISGEYAFVGEPNVGGGGGRGGGGRGGAAAGPAAGTVHVYRRGPAGWKEVDVLKSPATRGGDGFGTSVVADGTTLLVGQVAAPPAAAGGGRGGRGGRGAADAAPPPAPTDPGAVYVFRRGTDGKYTSAGTLTANQSPGSDFGSVVAVAGDLALVGAPLELLTGSVFVFRRSPAGQWAAAGSLAPVGLAAGDRFGSSVAIDGARIAVGAAGREAKGAVYLFHRGTDGAWAPEDPTPMLVSRGLPDGSNLGAAVALKGDRLIAGAPEAGFSAPPPAGGRGAGGGGGRGGGGPPVPGVAVVFQQYPDGRWVQEANLAPFDLGAASRFGASVSFVGDEAWIGAPGSEGYGRVYRVRRDKDGSWGGMTKLGVDSLDATINAGAQFATSFAVSADAAIFGMPGDGGGSGTAAFLGKSPTGAWTVRNVLSPPQVEALAAVTGHPEMKCVDGKASGFDCNNVSLMSFLPLSQIGARPGIRLSGSWGWTDPVTGHDISIVGRSDGAAFVDITDPARPRYLGDLLRPKGSNTSTWKEMKTYKNYVLVVSDGSGDHHGIQFFDLTRLRTVKAPQHFTEDAHYFLGSIHNIVVNEQSGFAYAVGTNNSVENCGGGSHVIDIRDPKHPKFAGCVQDMATGRRKTGYTHDGQCVMYHGPDKRFTGKEICLMANETHISVQDVTDKSNPKMLSHVDYPGVAYAHQGWFTDDQAYWFEDDELDEGGFPGTVGAGGPTQQCPCGRAKEGTRTLVWDMKDLTDPILVKEYIATTKETDHNQYVKGNRLYQSNYGAGFHVLDITDPANPHEVGFMNPGGSTWSNYPYFKNGTQAFTMGSQGLFVVKDRSTNTVP